MISRDRRRSLRAVGVGAGGFLLWSAVVLVVGWAWGQSRLVTSAASPDGEWVAFVRAHASIDPPNESLWLGPSGGPHVKLARLAEDQDWCDEIVWNGDGSRVGFLVRGARLDVYRVPDGRFLGSTELVATDGYPGFHEAREVRFTPDGDAVRFTFCVRGQAPCLGEREVELAAARRS